MLGEDSSNKLSCLLVFFVLFLDLFSIRFANVLNSNSWRIFASSASFGSSTCKSSSFKSIGTSVRMVAKNWDILISSMAFSTFSRNLPLISCVRCSISSMLPNWLISLIAVFSPTPGQPGKLSAVSPMRAKISMTCNGESMLYLAQISFSPSVSYPPPCLGRYIHTCSPTNCP